MSLSFLHSFIIPSQGSSTHRQRRYVKSSFQANGNVKTPIVIYIFLIKKKLLWIVAVLCFQGYVSQVILWQGHCLCYIPYSGESGREKNLALSTPHTSVTLLSHIFTFSSYFPLPSSCSFPFPLIIQQKLPLLFCLVLYNSRLETTLGLPNLVAKVLDPDLTKFLKFSYSQRLPSLQALTWCCVHDVRSLCFKLWVIDYA